MDLGDVTIDETLNKRDRNYEIRIDCRMELGGNYEVIAHREVVHLKNGSLYPCPLNKGYLIRKKLSEIATVEVTLASGKVLTGAELAEGMEKMTDLYYDPNV